MPNIVYPVYKHVGYFEREYLYYASSQSRADEFLSAYNKVSMGAGHNGAYYGISRPLPAGSKENTYRGWTIDFEYGYYSATHDNYDASYEGPEDGWVDNGLKVCARTLPGLIIEIIEHPETTRAEQAKARLGAAQSA